jgi:myosin heavy subunit
MAQKIIIGLLFVIVVYLLLSSRSEQQARLVEQQQLNQSLQALQQTVKQQESELLAKQQAVISQAESQTALLEEQLAASKKHSAVLDQRLQESVKQTEVMDQQINTLDSVVQNLAEKQHKEQQMQAEYDAMAKKALQASYRVGGLQTASMIKTMVAEYYFMEGRFPHSNTVLGIQRPTAYANEQVKSITVSKGGRITVVYTARSGQENGAINLTPKEKNGQLEWRCSSWDFEDIRDSMPTCFYGG